MTAPAVPRIRLWVIWVVGLAAYMVGVMQRTSFGIAGLDAAARFHASPAALSGFVVLQLLVYASLQVPAGVLLDRFGARKLVVAGALIMAAGQLVLAVASGLPLAITARTSGSPGASSTSCGRSRCSACWWPGGGPGASWPRKGSASRRCGRRSRAVGDDRPTVITRWWRRPVSCGADRVRRRARQREVDVRCGVRLRPRGLPVLAVDTAPDRRLGALLGRLAPPCWSQDHLSKPVAAPRGGLPPVVVLSPDGLGPVDGPPTCPSVPAADPCAWSRRGPRPAAGPPCRRGGGARSHGPGADGTASSRFDLTVLVGRADTAGGRAV